MDDDDMLKSPASLILESERHYLKSNWKGKVERARTYMHYLSSRRTESVSQSLRGADLYLQYLIEQHRLGLRVLQTAKKEVSNATTPTN
jgi:hypothetical protein